MTPSEKRKALDSLAQLLDEAPDFGEVGVVCRIHSGGLVCIDRRNSESIKLEAAGCRG